MSSLSWQQARLLRAAFALQIALICGASAIAQESDIDRADVLDRQVVQLYRQGRYADAIALATESLEIREKAFGPEHRDLAPSLNNLAELYRNQGRGGSSVQALSGDP